MAETSPHAPSGLTTLGRCLVAAGVSASVCSVLLDENDLLRIGVTVMVLVGLCAAVAARSRLVMRAERVLDPGRLSAGSVTQARLTVHTVRRTVGGGLVLRDALPDALGGSPRFVTHPARRGTPPLELTYPITPVVRGVHLVGPLAVRVSDPLGLAEYERELVGRSQLIVVPRTTELTGLPPGFGRGGGDSGTAGLRRGMGEFDALVRPYLPGDPLRSVHWRSTARRDELMVRVEEQPWHGGVTVLLDRRADAHFGRGAASSLEWAIELVASICRHLMLAGRRVSLVAENGAVLSVGRDPDQMLDVLATLRASTQSGLIAPAGEEGAVIAVLGAVNTGSVAPLLDGRGHQGHAVLLDTAAWATGRESRTPPGVAAPGRALADAGWGVQVGRPDRDPAQIWTEFRASLTARAGAGS